MILVLTLVRVLVVADFPTFPFFAFLERFEGSGGGVSHRLLLFGSDLMMGPAGGSGGGERERLLRSRSTSWRAMVAAGVEGPKGYPVYLSAESGGGSAKTRAFWRKFFAPRNMVEALPPRLATLRTGTGRERRCFWLRDLRMRALALGSPPSLTHPFRLLRSGCAAHALRSSRVSKNGDSASLARALAFFTSRLAIFTFSARSCASFSDSVLFEYTTPDPAAPDPNPSSLLSSASFSTIGALAISTRSFDPFHVDPLYADRPVVLC